MIQEYELDGGWTVLAGRTEADNDRLSIKLAKANDWWFHVRGMPGSHVVLRAREDAEPGKNVLRQAAALTKPRGADPGTVQIRKESVLKVRPALPSAAD